MFYRYYQNSKGRRGHQAHQAGTRVGKHNVDELQSDVYQTKNRSGISPDRAGCPAGRRNQQRGPVAAENRDRRYIRTALLRGL